MKRISLLFVLFAFLSTTTFAQDETKEETPKKWEKGLGIGLDFAQLLQINPRVGAGENRIGFGGALTYFANMEQGKHAWNNSVSWKIGVQKLGSGYVFGTEKQPFQKSIDELRFDSKYGYAVTPNKKWYLGTELSFLSQILKTYDGSLLTDLGSGNHELSKFLSPGTVTYSIGIDYKPTKKLSLYYSPLAMKAIIIADDDIAAMPAVDADGNFTGSSIHGTQWRGPTDYDKTLFLVGSYIKAQYHNKFLSFGKDEHRIHFKSYASFFFDYLQGQKKNDNPNYKTNIDVDWGTETNVVIVKGLSLVFTTNLFYDWDIPVQETDRKAVGGVSGNLVRRASFTQQLLIKYTHAF